MYIRRSIITLIALGSLGGFVISTAACGSSSTPSSPSTTSADVTATIVGNLGVQSFAPNPISMRVGQTVSWKNTDTITHDVTQDASVFATGSLAAGVTSAPIMMNTAGTFTYHCSIHPGMIGTVTVQ